MQPPPLLPPTLYESYQMCVYTRRNLAIYTRVKRSSTIYHLQNELCWWPNGKATNRLYVYPLMDYLLSARVKLALFKYIIGNY